VGLRHEAHLALEGGARGVSLRERFGASQAFQSNTGGEADRPHATCRVLPESPPSGPATPAYDPDFGAGAAAFGVAATARPAGAGRCARA